jgi:hypothetical protein
VVIGVGLRDDEIESISLWHPLATVRRVSVDCEEKFFSATVANRRPYWLREVMTNLPANVLLMDADLLVRCSIGPLLRCISDHQIGVVFRSGLDGDRVHACLRVAAGLLYVGRACRQFVEDWIAIMETFDRIEEIERNAWFWEQTCLYLTCLKHFHNCVTISSDLYLNAYPFSTEAPIWSAHIQGPGKDKLMEVFRQDFERLAGGVALTEIAMSKTE